MSLPEHSDRPIAVVGAGTLGRRIALMFASGGGTVALCDLDPDQLSAAKEFIDAELPAVVEQVADGAPAEVLYTDTLAEAVADAWLIVESLPERLDVKIPVFGQLDRLAPVDAILASNSSSHPTSRMIDEVHRPERVVNLHFFMPPRAAACELMSCGRTEPAVLDRLLAELPRFGLTPFLVREQSMGFILNRIWAAIKRESLMVLDEGVATPEDVDVLYRMVFGATRGPFEAMDNVGLDVVLDIENNYAQHRSGLPEAPRNLLRRYLDEGRLGKKSGRGFYNYSTETTA